MPFSKALLLSLLLMPVLGPMHAQIYQCDNGQIRFLSDAPLEVIAAKSEVLRGAVDADRRSFAFSVPIVSFQGFNAPLQRTHFNENYMESQVHPNAVFTGKIIESVDFTKDGRYTIRAKGKLKVHGISQERIIRADLIAEDGVLKIQAQFTVHLEEHGISIPKIVYQKIAELIEVTVDAVLLPQKN